MTVCTRDIWRLGWTVLNWLGRKCQRFYSRQWNVRIGDERGPWNSSDRTRKASRIVRCLRNAIFGRVRQSDPFVSINETALNWSVAILPVGTISPEIAQDLLQYRRCVLFYLSSVLLTLLALKFHWMFSIYNSV